jgi:tetratricopeptide (TPR) repeat protein
VQSSTALWQELGSREGVADSHTQLGYVLTHLGDFDASLVHLRRAVWLARRIGKPQELASALAELGRLRILRGDLRLATLLLRRALTVRRPINERYVKAEMLCVLGSAYRRLCRYDEAVRSQRQALAIMVDGGVPGGECLVLNYLGTTLFEAGQLDEAHGLHRRALHLAERIDYRIEQARAYDGLATTSADSHPALAREHWHRALQLFEDMGVPERHAVARKLAALDQGQLTHSSVPSAKT